MNNDPVIIKLTRAPVRLSYPFLFEPRPGPDGGKSAYSAVFILDKKIHAPEIKALQTAIEALKKATWGPKPPTLKGIFLHDGAEKPDVDGYGEEVMFISARNDKRPGVVDKDLTPLTMQDGKPYAGCYVFATLRIWPQDNKFGKRINAALRNVQFVKDGPPFGEKIAPVEDDFTPVEDQVDGVV